MENLILPDSNIYIGELRAGRDPFRLFDDLPDEFEFATCGQIILEVCRGIRDPHIARRIRESFSVMVYLPTPNTTWERATQLAWSLDRSGHVIPASDVLIATLALQVGATVLTHDAHFHRVPGLTVTASLR